MPLVRDHTLRKWDLELFSKKGRERLSGEVSSPPAPSAYTRAQTCPPGQNKSPPANESSSPQKHSRLPLGGGGRKGQREKGSGDKQKERGARQRDKGVGPHLHPSNHTEYSEKDWGQILFSSSC